MKTQNKKQIVGIVLAALVFAGTGLGQEKHEEHLAAVGVFGGYSLLRSEGENFHGWKTSVDINFNKWLALTVDGSGNYFSHMTSEGGSKESEHTLTAGPHVSWRNKTRLVPFAYATAGAVWESHSVADHGETHSGFAFETGGGVDWEISKKVSIRLFDLGSSVTRVDGHTTTKPKFATGVVFHFGPK